MKKIHEEVAFVDEKVFDEINSKTDVNIIAKQVIINTPTSARLIPITADERCIDEIQRTLDEHEQLVKDVKRYFEILKKPMKYEITAQDFYDHKELYVLEDKLSKLE